MARDITETPCILVDTGVWLDMYIPNRKGADDAIRLIDIAQEQSASLAFASHTCLDVFQKVSFEQKAWVRKHGALTERWATAIKRYAWDCVNDMQDIATAIPVDSNDLYLACRYRDQHDDLEDDLILAACKKAQANYLVTSDKKLLAHAPIEALTTSEMTRLLKAGLAKTSPVSATPRDATYWMYQWLSKS